MIDNRNNVTGNSPLSARERLIVKREKNLKKKECLPDCETCKKCGTNNCGNDTTNLQCYEPN